MTKVDIVLATRKKVLTANALSFYCWLQLKFTVYYNINWPFHLNFM